MERTSAIVMEEVTDPAEVSEARLRRAELDRNVAWLRTHATEVYERYRGKFICVAGEQVFADDRSEEARALAAAAHPGDQGSFVLYIPKEKMARVYVNQR
ncbi:MAG: hypothetical protein AABN34_24425 [Acidobacteriota bacterium]